MPLPSGSYPASRISFLASLRRDASRGSRRPTEFPKWRYFVHMLQRMIRLLFLRLKLAITDTYSNRTSIVPTPTPNCTTGKISLQTVFVPFQTFFQTDFFVLAAIGVGLTEHSQSQARAISPGKSNIRVNMNSTNNLIPLIIPNKTSPLVRIVERRADSYYVLLYKNGATGADSNSRPPIYKNGALTN